MTHQLGPSKWLGPKFIKGTHPYQFRSGQWAEILTTAPGVNGRDCYIVRFPDGAIDWWIVRDPSDPYEFSDDPSVLETVV